MLERLCWGSLSQIESVMTHTHINPAGLISADTFEDRGHSYVRVRMADRHNGDSVDLILSVPAFTAFAERISALCNQLAETDPTDG
jgi:hypothetical protein